MKNVIVIGSGGHAKVIIDIIQSMNKYKIIGITSQSFIKGEMFIGHEVIGDIDVLREYNPMECLIAMGIGGFRDNLTREKNFIAIKNMGFSFLNVIHPSAIISKTCLFGEGIVIFPGVILNTDVSVGDNTIIATGSTIDHETVIGKHTLVSAGVTIGAYTKINDHALIALGAKVVSGINIGKNSLVAAGAVVIKDVQDKEIVYGIPAKPIKVHND